MSDPGRRRPGLVPCILLAACLAGCSSGRDLEPVEGKVLLGERPLTTGTVILRPDASKGNTSRHEPRGAIAADGRYQAATALRPGAPPGWYKVGVIATVPADPANPYAIPTSLIPTEYNDPEHSGLSLHVGANPAADAYDIKLPAK